jgi:hypothetical protein
VYVPDDDRVTTEWGSGLVRSSRAPFNLVLDYPRNPQRRAESLGVYRVLPATVSSLSLVTQ